jgi:hypothetical protein
MDVIETFPVLCILRIAEIQHVGSCIFFKSLWYSIHFPQGSVLGSLFFLLYINDLPNVMLHNATPILFADDTNILITGQNVLKFQDDLSATFGHISNWFQAKLILFNFLVKV